VTDAKATYWAGRFTQDAEVSWRAQLFESTGNI
jgi:hypothetical protein